MTEEKAPWLATAGYNDFGMELKTKKNLLVGADSFSSVNSVVSSSEEEKVAYNFDTQQEEISRNEKK